MVPERQKLFELLIMLLGAGNHQSMPHVAPMIPSAHEIKVLAMGEFRKGVGCIAGFRRYGYRVTTKQCVAMAKVAHIEVQWFQPDSDQPATIIIPVKEGDPFAVIQKKGVKQFVLQKK